MKRQTWSITLVLCLTKLVTSEPPVSSGGRPLVSQRLLNRVADILANGGDSLSRDDRVLTNEGSSIVDQELLDRVARIITQNEGQFSWSGKAHHVNPSETAGQPSKDLSLPSGREQYGTPPVEVPFNARDLVGSQFELSPPEPVPRIASFTFTEADEDSFFGSQYNQDSYADNRNFNGNDKIQLGEPKNADRIASFDIEGELPPAPYAPPQARGNYKDGR